MIGGLGIRLNRWPLQSVSESTHRRIEEGMAD